MPVFKITEDTYFKGFLYASVVVGVSNAFMMEYQVWDPFKTYKKEGDRAPSGAAILQTSLVGTLATFTVLWVLYFIFGLGNVFVAHSE